MITHDKSSVLISPYGDSLIDLMVPTESQGELKATANRLPSIQISDRSVCDLELLASGGFSPLDRFMGKADYERVIEEMRLNSGFIFPIPITLSVDPSDEIHLDSQIVLRNSKNELLAIMTVDEIYEWDRDELAAKVFDTQDVRHPLIAEMQSWGKLNISGRLQVLQLPTHHDFKELRLTPTETRAKLESFEYSNKNLTSRPESISREGALEFWSSGGMLHEISPGGSLERYEVLSLNAKHIKVLTLVEGQAAVAHYYSEGSLQPEGYPAVTHYLTRVTQVFVKENGEWKIRSAHWSPLQGGSGTSQTAEAKPK